MAFCKNCGTSMDDGVVFCPSCGTKREEVAAAGAQASQQAGAASTAAGIMNTPDSTNQFDAKDIEESKVMAVLAYLGILILVPILAAPNSKFARFHSNQGLILIIASVGYSIVASILSFILAFIPVIGWIISALVWLVSCAFVVLVILGIVNAAGGKAKELPLIGKFKILKY